MSVVSCARSRTGTGIAPRSCEHDDGSLRVRKSSRGDAPPGPWGLAALRKEIAYLSTLPPRARAVFPPLLAAWDDAAADPPRVGYEIPFYADHFDAGALARRRALAQAEIDQFQDALAEVAARTGARVGAAANEPLSVHLVSVVDHALGALEADPDSRGWFAPNRSGSTARRRPDRGRRLRGPAPTARSSPPSTPNRRCGCTGICSSRTCCGDDQTRPPSPAVGPQLLLIDPVSVAGVTSGPPLFDLVKYESYATGELAALRSDWVDVGGFDGGDDYTYGVRWQSAELAAFRALDWHTRFRRAFNARYGPVEGRAYRLIDGYFSVAMAVNTGGTQRRARLLKATQDFNAAASPGVIP